MIDCADILPTMLKNVRSDARNIGSRYLSLQILSEDIRQVPKTVSRVLSDTPKQLTILACYLKSVNKTVFCLVP